MRSELLGNWMIREREREREKMAWAVFFSFLACFHSVSLEECTHWGEILKLPPGGKFSHAATNYNEQDKRNNPCGVIGKSTIKYA